MKSILMSIQPKWCEKIINGEKTIEVRKTAPKEVPFKAYIYCTKGGKILREAFYPNGKPDKKYFYLADRNRNHEKNLNGKIIGEFVVNGITEFTTDYRQADTKQLDTILAKACLSFEEAVDYDNGKCLYALNITELKIYDKPKELGELETYDYKIAQDVRQPCPYKKLTRPPQSWQYVETPDWAEEEI